MCVLWIPVSEHQLSDALGWVAEVIMPHVE